LILGVALIILGVQVGLIGLIADLVGVNRQIMEETLYRVRKMELNAAQFRSQACPDALDAVEPEPRDTQLGKE